MNAGSPLEAVIRGAAKTNPAEAGFVCGVLLKRIKQLSGPCAVQ